MKRNIRKVIRQLIKEEMNEEIQLLKERSTWSDIRKLLPAELRHLNDNDVPIALPKYKLIYLPTKKIFNIKSADEKFIQIKQKVPSDYKEVERNEIPVGDGLVFAKNWALTLNNKIVKINY